MQLIVQLNKTILKDGWGEEESGGRETSFYTRLGEKCINSEHSHWQ